MPCPFPAVQHLQQTPNQTFPALLAGADAGGDGSAPQRAGHDVRPQPRVPPGKAPLSGSQFAPHVDRAASLPSAVQCDFDSRTFSASGRTHWGAPADEARKARLVLASSATPHRLCSARVLSHPRSRLLLPVSIVHANHLIPPICDQPSYKQRDTTTKPTGMEPGNYKLMMDHMCHRQAEFYTCASTGSGIPASLRGGGPPSRGCRSASISDPTVKV